MIDSPWRLLPARGYGKFNAVQDIEFAALAAGFGDPKRCQKRMIQMGFLFRRVPGDSPARVTPVPESPHPESLSLSSSSETMP